MLVFGIVNLTKIPDSALSSEAKGASLEGEHPRVYKSSYKALFFLFLRKCIHLCIKLTMPSCRMGQFSAGVAPCDRQATASTRMGNVGRPRMRQVWRHGRLRSTQRFPGSLRVP